MLAKELIAEITDQESNRPGEKIALCSSEAFTTLCGPNGAAHLTAFLMAFEPSFPVQALLIIREFTDLVESMYLQSVRFGNEKGPFQHYVKSRKRWVENLFQGIKILENNLGESLLLEYQNDNFDILEYCDHLLPLPPGLLRQASALVSPTAKPSLKTQAVLTYKTQIEAAVGFPFERHKLVSAMARGSFFDNDVRRYTLYSPEFRRQTYDSFMQIARAQNAAGYVDAFSHYRCRDLPHYDLEFGLLDQADLEKIVENRPKLMLGS